ncbi:MAG: hypothetical protein JWM90_2626, partial [Thermoleophilia bacterium]|nr:hypothetical protein [Thermoleophilia bacterium]
ATARDAAAVDAALEAFDLTSFAARRVDRLSGGERRLVHLARTHAQATPLLLLDEPLAHLDLAHARTALDAIDATLEARGGAAITVLHEPAHALAWASRIVLLRDGAVLADVAPSALDGELLSACYATPVQLVRDAQGRAIGISRDAPRG